MYLYRSYLIYYDIHKRLLGWKRSSMEWFRLWVYGIVSVLLTLMASQQNESCNIKTAYFSFHKLQINNAAV